MKSFGTPARSASLRQVAFRFLPVHASVQRAAHPTARLDEEKSRQPAAEIKST
jgi:hypothetical protein